MLLTRRRRAALTGKEAEAETAHSNEGAALSSEPEGQASWGGRGLPRPRRSETPVPTAKPGQARAAVGGQRGLAGGPASTPGDREAVARDARQGQGQGAHDRPFTEREDRWRGRETPRFSGSPEAEARRPSPTQPSGSRQLSGPQRPGERTADEPAQRRAWDRVRGRRAAPLTSGR